jgi:hypothetical protein
VHTRHVGLTANDLERRGYAVLNTGLVGDFSSAMKFIVWHGVHASDWLIGLR